MTQLTGTGAVVVAQGIFQESADRLHALGELTHTNDGRAYRYCEAGGTALVAGNLQQSSVEDTGDQDLAVAAAAVGAREIVTTSTVTVTANQYANGFALITVTPGLGHIYKISGHAAATTAVVTLDLADAIEVALTTASRVDLIQNPFANVILNPATPTSAPIGVAVTALPADQFGWLQVLGPACVEAETAIAVGNQVVADDADAGCVAPTADGANELDAHVGVALTGIADGEFGAIRLALL